MTVSSAAIGPKQAAEMVGRSKAAIIKAIREGRISAEKDGNGEWRIEPVELLRVYQPANTDTPTDTAQVNNGSQAQVNGLQAEIEGLRELVDTLKSERDDLRGRLDRGDEERRQLTARLLTDQRVQEARKGLLARWFGGR